MENNQNRSKFLNNLFRFTKIIIGWLLWTFGLAILIVGSSNMSVEFGTYVFFAYIILSILFWFFYLQWKKMPGEKSVKGTFLYMRDNMVAYAKKLLVTLKQLVLAMFYFGAIVIVMSLVGWGLSGISEWLSSPDEDSIYMDDYSDEAYKTPYSPIYKKDCSNLEPDNPYPYGSGHYEGFKWGERGKSCGGNSRSFVEGCEKYFAQEEAYDSCLYN